MKGECPANYFTYMCNITGYEPQTTFWENFMISERFGARAIRNTYERVMKEWKNNYIYLTELVMILNWNLWYWDGAGTRQSEEYAKLYDELWSKTDEYALTHLQGDELSYFLRTVD